MSIEIRVPTLGESIVDATIASWRKKEGDAVRIGDALVELETDKVNVEVNAEQDGVLQKVVKREGDVVAIGDVLGIIGEGAEAHSTTAARGADGTSATTDAAATAMQRPPSPLARRIADEHNVDISQVRGTSPHGRITREDVINYLEQNTGETQHARQAAEPPNPLVAPKMESSPSATAVQSASGNGSVIAPPTQQGQSAPQGRSAIVQQGREERIRMSRRRQTIAQRLVQAQHTAAMLTTFNEVDMTAIMEIRSRRKDSFKEQHQVSLGFMSFFTKAVIGALKVFPRLNAEIQGDEVVLKHYYDIGIAVGAEEGLVVPIVRDADSKNFAVLEREIAELAKKARENKLSLSELQGGTFTITNGGVFGSLLSTPILNGPQVGILGMHKIEQRPVALSGQVVIRPMMYVALSYDHRIVDGREAVQFLVRVKELLEDPEMLLLEG